MVLWAKCEGFCKDSEGYFDALDACAIEAKHRNIKQTRDHKVYGDVG